MRALDLFCGAGGASMGLHRAGFEMIAGIDIKVQKHYPFKFFLGDALTWLDWKRFVDAFDFIWASPPCQAYSISSLSQRTRGKRYPDLVAPTREKLEATGKPYVIENVPAAPIRADVVLCGSMFGLRTIRHRHFECNWLPLHLVPPCAHPEVPISVVGHGTPSWTRAKNGGKCFGIKEYRAAMGIDWMNRDELSEAIPPAYSEWIGRKFLRKEL